MINGLSLLTILYSQFLCAFFPGDTLPHSSLAIIPSSMESSRSLCFVPSQAPPFSGDDGQPPKALQLSSGNVGFNGSDASFDDFKTGLVDGYHLGEALSILNSGTTNVEGNPSHLEERRRRRRRDGTKSYPWRRRNVIRYELDSERYRQYRDKQNQNSDQKWVSRLRDFVSTHVSNANPNIYFSLMM